jgi:hypothetical protein
VDAVLLDRVGGLGVQDGVEVGFGFGVFFASEPYLAEDVVVLLEKGAVAN